MMKTKKFKNNNNSLNLHRKRLKSDHPDRRKKIEDIITSSDSDDYEVEDNGEGSYFVEEETETTVGKLKRLAEAKIKEIRDEYEDDERDRDSLVSRVLQGQQLEDSGRVRKLIASRVQKQTTTDGFQVLVKHRQSVTSVVLSEDDSKGFSASKDGYIVQWDVESGKKEAYAWPSDQVFKSHRLHNNKHVLALAVSSDGRYLASGGFDQHVHLWDTRTREHIQAFPGHKGHVSCLSFRQGTSQLFSGSYDRTIKIWNAEERLYMDTLFGHQSHVLTIDCLRKERVLTAGCDRTMHLWKVPEESQLVFRASAASLECCCFINNDEFLSGSDDGSIEHWSVLRKKPLHIVKNAHPSSVPNGLPLPEKVCSSVNSWISSVSVCRGSDLAASGAGNGVVRLWEVKSDAKGLVPLFELPLAGYVNALAFAKSGKFLVAGVGKEPRLGRWGSLPCAQHGVVVHPLHLL